MTCDFLRQLGVWFLASEWFALTLNCLPIVDHLQKDRQCQSFLFCCASKRCLDRVWKVYLLICTIPLKFLDTNIGMHQPVHICIFVVARFCWLGLLWAVLQILCAQDPYRNAVLMLMELFGHFLDAQSINIICMLLLSKLGCQYGGSVPLPSHMHRGGLWVYCWWLWTL